MKSGIISLPFALMARRVTIFSVVLFSFSLTSCFALEVCSMFLCWVKIGLQTYHYLCYQDVKEVCLFFHVQKAVALNTFVSHGSSIYAVKEIGWNVFCLSSCVIFCVILINFKTSLFTFGAYDFLVILTSSSSLFLRPLRKKAKDKRKEKIKKINQKQNKNRCLLCAKFSRNAPCCCWCCCCWCCCCCMRYPADWVGKDDLLVAAVGFLSSWDILFFRPPCCNSLSLSLYLLNKNNKYDIETCS